MSIGYWSNPMCYLSSCHLNLSRGYSATKYVILENLKPHGHHMSLESTRVQASNWFLPFNSTTQLWIFLYTLDISHIQINAGMPCNIVIVNWCCIYGKTHKHHCDTPVNDLPILEIWYSVMISEWFSWTGVISWRILKYTRNHN